jgi:hypothetical protein
MPRAKQDKDFQNIWATILKKCNQDPKYKERVYENATQVFKEEGFLVPKGKEIRVLKNSKETCYLNLPTKEDVEVAINKLSEELKCEKKHIDEDTTIYALLRGLILSFERCKW